MAREGPAGKGMRIVRGLSAVLFLSLSARAEVAVSTDTMAIPDRGTHVWAIAEPLQCLANAWEKDWIAKHKKQADKYPIREERAIIKEFFTRKGIRIADMRLSKGGPTCASCECPRGDKLFLLIEANDAQALEPYGFKKRLPYEPKR
jgi:hypothetical protein